ncbi:DUF1592 domain-containing protein [Mariniblastus sp.]|nr:DUF1592 domain-containing protein [Mariniblastus sp.]
MIHQYLLATVLIMLMSGGLWAQDPSFKADSFLKDFCFKCHAGSAKKGDRQFDNIDLKSLNQQDLALLEEAINAINRGEMPPSKSPQPADVERRMFVASVEQELNNQHLNSADSTTILRRMTRDEYRNTIRDLLDFNTNAFDPTADFPSDSRTDGFANVGKSQVLSDFQLKKYMKAAQGVLERASYFGYEKPESKLLQFMPEQMSHKDKYDRAPVLWILNVDNQYLDIGHGQPVERHATYPRAFSKTGVPHDGYYDIRVKASAINRLDHPYTDKDFEYDFRQPMKLGMWIAPTPDLLVKGASEGRRLVKVFDLVDEEAKVYSATVWLTKGSTPFVHWVNGFSSKGTIRKVGEKYHPEVMRPKQYAEDMAKNGGIEAERQLKERAKNTKNRLLSEVYEGPRVRIFSMAIEGPHYTAWPPESHQKLYGKTLRAEDLNLKSAISQFAQRAFRRKLEPDEFEHYIQFVKQKITDGEPADEAIRLGFAAILTSPRFLYLDEGDEEKGTELSSFELASRLSYFLWNSMPDEELFRIARENRLNEPNVIREQVERMLQNPKSSVFIENFADSWLRLNELGSMPPDSKTFKSYYRHRLESAMKQETYHFLQDLLDENGSIFELLNSQHTFVNDSLATHYGLEGDFGEGFQKISIPESLHRGGLLGQASVLTVTANGVETSPVTRGVWILENLLGSPPSPPPPDVEPIEPDTRGTTTIREQLLKHRSVTACADCHAKIDPLGFALEFYDPIGTFRSKYPAKGLKGKGKLIDGTGNFPDGDSFNNEHDLKMSLMSRKKQFAKTLAEKLLIFGTGRTVSFQDHQEIEQLAQSVDTTTNGFRDLVKSIATSQIFRSR